MTQAYIVVVDDDEAVRDSTARLLKRAGFSVGTFSTGDALLEDSPEDAGCILLDIRMPGTDGIGVLRALQERQRHAPVIVMTGHGDVPLAVEAMKLGAFDFLEKPYPPQALIDTIEAALKQRPEEAEARRNDPEAEAAVAGLSWRQRQVLAGILCGHPNKIIAYELGLSIRTVEAYRAQLLTRLKVRGTADAVKVALAAGLDPKEFGRKEDAAGE